MAYSYYNTGILLEIICCQEKYSEAWRKCVNIRLSQTKIITGKQAALKWFTASHGMGDGDTGLKEHSDTDLRYCFEFFNVIITAALTTC
jgi:hypothetical protein